MHCPRCNAQVSSLGMVCPSCGAVIRRGQEDLSQSRPKSVEELEAEEKRAEERARIRAREAEKKERAGFYRALTGAIVSLVIINIGSNITVYYHSELQEILVRLFGFLVAAAGTACFARVIMYIRSAIRIKLGLEEPWKPMDADGWSEERKDD